MERLFSDIMDKQFSDLLHEFYELEAELDKLKSVSQKTFENLLKENNYGEFERLIGIMYRTSQNQSETFKRMDLACLELIKKVKPSDKTKVNKLIAMITDAGKQGLVYASRLPFSIDQGWMPGSISNIRELVNLPGYLLIIPFLRFSKDNSRSRRIYAKCLFDIKNLVGSIRKDIKELGYIKYNQETKKEIEHAMNDFKVFIVLTNKLHRRFRKLTNDCKRIYGSFTYVIEEDIVYKSG